MSPDPELDPDQLAADGDEVVEGVDPSSVPEVLAAFDRDDEATQAHIDEQLSKVDRC